MSEGTDYLQTSYAHLSDKYLAAQALADKRLVLLKRVNTVRMYADVPCPICLEKPKHRYIGDTVSLVDSHADDCELAEAIDAATDAR